VAKKKAKKKPEKEKKFTFGFKYQVRDTTVYVRNRPSKRMLTIDCERFVDEERADAYLSVTDTFVTPPKSKPLVWIPWNEHRLPTPEQYYGANKTLNQWIYYNKLKKVSIFCDAGTHRSVTIFGIYLLTYFSRKEAEEIVKNRVDFISYNKGDDPKDYSGIANPLEYAEGYLNRNPVDRLLLDMMGKDYLWRLDMLSQQIVKTVKERYADNRGEDEL